MESKINLSLKWKYVPTECATCGPDLIYLKCKHSKPYTFAIYKAVCEYAEIDAVEFYDQHRSTSTYVGIDDEFYFYIDDEFMFVITDHSPNWDKFDELINGYHDVEPDFNEMIEKNIGFEINESDLEFYPLDMVKIEKGKHIVIREYRDEDEEGVIQNSFPYGSLISNDGKYLGRCEKKTVHIKKGGRIPCREYDLEPFFDPYEVWPYRSDLRELLFNFIETNVNFDYRFVISFYSFYFTRKNGICASGRGSFIYAFNIEDDDKRERTTDPRQELVLRTNKETLRERIMDLDVAGIEYNECLDIRKSDQELLRYKIRDALEDLCC